MTEEQEKKQKHGIWTVVVLLLLFVVYPMSNAPVVSLYADGYLPNGLGPGLRVFYAPLQWARRSGPGVDNLLESYSITLWGIDYTAIPDHAP